jgi:hypothetical protein
VNQGKATPGGSELPLADGLVWVCLAVAVAATVYVLLKEPEDGTPKTWDPALVSTLARFQAAALGASVLAGLAGLARVVSRGGGPGLFGMATLFNVILACFWTLRFLLVP